MNALLALLLVAAPPTALTPQLMKGKQKTDRSIVLNVVLDAPRDEVFRLWTTREGCNRFFGQDAVIELKPAGAYEIYFLERSDPQSDAHSTRGARLLWVHPQREIAFEWKVPPFAAELNAHPLPTWVEVQLREVDGRAGKTHLRVCHYGFGRGATWDQVYEFFVRNWSDILYRLDHYCATSDGRR